MFLKFAWRYFKAKKSANSINIIAWVTTGVIAFATCCQILVLSVFNGFEDIVKSLYSTFYADVQLTPLIGKTFYFDSNQLAQLHRLGNIQKVSCIIEEKALLKKDDLQSIVHLKGVDNHYVFLSDISTKIINGKYEIGDAENPKIVLGVGIQEATGIHFNEAYGPENLVAILPKSNNTSNNPIETLSEGFVSASGSFSVQQEFDNSYAITNIDFIRQQAGLHENEYTSIEIKLKNSMISPATIAKIKKLVGQSIRVQDKYQQNENLYTTMKTEKWAIFALLCLILIIAAFNMISSLTMLVLEKKQDIYILQSMGATKQHIKNIFLAEGLLIGILGTMIGVGMAILICFMQIQYQLVKLEGGSFLIDYFPVKIVGSDIVLVSITALLISLLAAWLPSHQASQQKVNLK